MAVGARHSFCPWERVLYLSKRAFKRRNWPYVAALFMKINIVRRSDPAALDGSDK